MVTGHGAGAGTDLFDALDTLDSGQPLADLAAVFPNLRAAHGGSSGFGAAADVGWTSMILRLLARLDSTASHAGTTIPITEVKEKFGLLRVYLDLGDADRSLQTRCDALIADAEAESACRCQRCGALGEMAQDRRYLVVLCQHHRQSCAGVVAAAAPELSAHTRLHLAARFGAEGWHEVRSPFAAPLLRARLVEDDVAFAISLRGNPRDAARPQVVAAALYHDDGSALEIPGEAVMVREADLAARIAAALQI